MSSVSLSASQTVFDGYPGGRAAAAVQQADYTYRAAQVAYDASLKSVIYQVKQAYYTLLVDQKTVLIRQATVTQDQQNLAYYQGLLTAGRATHSTSFRTRSPSRRPSWTFAPPRTRWRWIAGTFPWQSAGRWTRNTSWRTVRFPDLPSLQLDEALKTAFQNRSELLTFDLNIAAANINLALQKSQTYPVVSVNGGLGLGQDWSANVNAGSFSLGASIALPILDGGLRNAQVQQAADQIASYKVQQDQERQSITVIAVQNALFGVQDTRNRLDLAGQKREGGAGPVRPSEGKICGGVGDNPGRADRAAGADHRGGGAGTGKEQLHPCAAEPRQRHGLIEGNEMKTAPKAIIITGAVIIVAIVAVIVLRPLFAQRDGIHYITRPVGFADISATVSETGTVNPVNTVSVGSEVSGTIIALGADYNSRVKKNQVLATLDPTDYQAAVDSAKANLSLAQANLNSAKVNVGKMKALLDLANLTVQRDEPLLKQGLINQNQMDTDNTAAVTANQDYLASQAAVQVAEAQVAVAQGQLDQAAVQPVQDRDQESLGRHRHGPQREHRADRGLITADPDALHPGDEPDGHAGGHLRGRSGRGRSAPGGFGQRSR